MMDGMTAKAKIAVTLPADLVESARSAVQAGRASSVSAYVAGALEQRVKLDELDLLLAEMLAETGGPLTEVERAEIDREAGWRSA
jgi:Arc/MetJ-type ribon-helix-helix transcriptional regulator